MWCKWMKNGAYLSVRGVVPTWQVRSKCKGLEFDIQWCSSKACGFEHCSNFPLENLKVNNFSNSNGNKDTMGNDFLQLLDDSEFLQLPTGQKKEQPLENSKAKHFRKKRWIFWLNLIYLTINWLSLSRFLIFWNDFSVLKLYSRSGWTELARNMGRKFRHVCYNHRSNGRHNRIARNEQCRHNCPARNILQLYSNGCHLTNINRILRWSKCPFSTPEYVVCGTYCQHIRRYASIYQSLLFGWRSTILCKQNWQHQHVQHGNRFRSQWCCYCQVSVFPQTAVSIVNELSWFASTFHRYRKFHLSIEPEFQAPQRPDLVTFRTDFNLTFGVFICFDLWFYSPPVALFERGVRNFVYPTDSSVMLPFLSSEE